MKGTKINVKSNQMWTGMNDEEEEEWNLISLHCMVDECIGAAMMTINRTNRSLKIIGSIRNTYSGLGGSLANSVPSFRPRSFGSSGSLSVSELSIGSNGLTICCCCWWWLALDDCCEFDLLDAGACWRLFRGGASGWACCYRSEMRRNGNIRLIIYSSATWCSCSSILTQKKKNRSHKM